MFEEYKSAILDFYFIKRDNRQLSTYLENPGRDKLRRECVAVFLRKNSKKDKEFIQSFFDPTNRFNDQTRSIEKFKLDKFRPLVSFLTNGTNVRDEGLVKLLAWLLDFHTYEEWRDLKYGEPNNQEEEHDNDTDSKEPNESDGSNLPDDDTSNQGNGNSTQEGSTSDENDIDIDKPAMPPENEEQEEDGPKVPPPPPSLLKRFILWLERGSNSNKKKFTLALIPVALTAFAAYTFFEYINQQCMYWTGNQYQAVGCSVKMNQASIIALDEEKLANLKRITRLDTIGRKDLGRVWYVKIKQDSAEFYTSAGEYPLNPKKRLLPMTQYILDKYILR